MDLEVVVALAGRVDSVDQADTADTVARVYLADLVARAGTVDPVDFTDGSGRAADMAVAGMDRAEVAVAVCPDVCCTSLGLPAL